MIGDTRQNLAQIRLRIESVEFCRANQAVDGSSTLAARVGTREQIVLPVMYTCT